ncbi:MAG TPA: vWA domain-containing protein, partial [Polyangiaceae bacterium]
RFGLALYTSDKGFGPGMPPKTCPIITAVPPALNNYAAIAAKYLPDDWKGDTPTGESVDAAVKILDGVSEEGPKAIVLATDGEPDSCADPNPVNAAGSEAARQLSVSAVQNAFKKQISTFVISVGNQVGEDHLRAVANAGQGLAVDVDTKNRFYLANNQADLAAAFDTIVGGVRSCVFALDGTVDDTRAGTGTVILDGKSLIYQDKDGWRMTAPSMLELQGAACAAIKSGDHDLKIDFPCGVIIPIVPK